MATPTPRLDDLHIADCAFPINVPVDKLDRVRHLVVLRAPFDWEDSGALTRLTTLEMEHMTNDPAVSQLIAVLEASPGLVTLALKLPRSKGSPTADAENLIPLVRLRELSLQLTPSATRDILTRIRIPECRSFNIECAGVPQKSTVEVWDRSTAHLDSILRSILSTAQSAKITVTPEAVTLRTGPSLNIYISTGMHFDRLTWMNGMLEALDPLPRIDLTLHAVYAPIFDKAIPILSSACPVEKLQLNHMDESVADPIVAFLGQPMTLEGQLHWPLPHLTTLAFYECDFDAEEFVEMIRERYEGVKSPSSTLSGLLELDESYPKGQQKNLAPLVRLEVTGENKVRSWHVVALRELVGRRRVVWTENEESEEENDSEDEDE